MKESIGKIYINHWIFLPKKSPNCNNTRINLNNHDSILNPIVGRCNKKNCRKIIYIRRNSFFQIFSHLPITIILDIIDMNINQEFNAKKICNKLVEKYKLNTMRYGTILDILEKLRTSIAYYINDNYSIESISKKMLMKYL